MADGIRVKTDAGGWCLPDAAYNEAWISRITRKVAVSETGCWLWMGLKSKTWGYAQDQYRGKVTAVHRRLYMIVSGLELRRDQYVCHSCDVRHCVNPAHMWVGTNGDNQRDSSRKARHYESRRTHCEHGHQFTPENTYLRKSKSGGVARQCKECDRERLRRYWREQPEKMRTRQNAWRKRKKAEREQRLHS